MANVSIANSDAQLSGKNVDLLESDQTITGLKTFNRGAQAPFAVAAGSLVVSNLIAEDASDSVLLNGQADTYYLASGNHTGLQTSNAPGRLTLTTALPVTTADVAAAGTIYYTPYNGSRIAVYSGSAWVMFTLTEISLALTVASGSIYDVFVYSNSGTLTLELSAAWASSTTRTDAISLQNGILVKTSATTRRYLGTIRGSGVNTTEDSMAKRFVWNCYNRVARPLRVIEATDTWNYSTATVRQLNNSAANQIEVVCGVAEDLLEIEALANAASTTAGDQVTTGIGAGVSNAIVSGCLRGTVSVPVANYVVTPVARYVVVQPQGYQFYTIVEWANAGGTVTWRGDNGSATSPQAGIQGIWKA